MKERREKRGGRVKRKKGRKGEIVSKEKIIREDKGDNRQNTPDRDHRGRLNKNETGTFKRRERRRIWDDRTSDSSKIDFRDREGLKIDIRGIREKGSEEDRAEEGRGEVQGREKIRGTGNDRTSVSSEIDLTDRHKLQRGIKDIMGRGERNTVVEEEGTAKGGDKIGENTSSDRGEESNIVDNNIEREEKIEKEKMQSVDENVVRYKQWTEEVRLLESSNSEITTSSIAALFVDKHLEREGRKIGRKQATRRKVWEKWRGIVRGSIRRDIKRKVKIERKVEKDKQDRQLVFDYTTKGLTAEEMKLLGRGEGFCVVDHNIDEDKTKVDIYQYQRRLRLHEMFREGSREEEQLEVDIGTVGRETQRREDMRGGRQSRLSIIEAVVSRNTVDGTIERRGTRLSTPARVGNRQSHVGEINRLRDTERVSRGRNRDPGVREVGRTTPMTTGRGGRGTRESRLSRIGRGTVGSVISRERRENRDNRIVQVTKSSGGRQEGNGRRGTQRGGDRGTRGRGTQSRRSTIVRRSIGRVESTGEKDRGVEREREIDQREKGRRLPSMYDPQSQNRSLNRYNTCIQEEILLAIGEKKTKFKDNISIEERKALKSLKRRIEEKEIIITKADKGSGLVAIDYETYVKKGTKYIEEEVGAYNRVQESQQSIINRVIKERNKIAEQLKEKGVIMGQTATYIKKQLEEKITGIKFYYKIHKDKNIESMPLRPLQSCIKAPIQHLSIVLTDILQPLLTEKNIPTFIFDSNQLLYRLKKLGSIPENCTLVSSDVSALYPSIPHREGFRAMKIFLEEKTRYVEEQIEEIMTALRLVITENYMVWNRQTYKQISGVAMGTPVAVAYANIFMNWVDGEVKRRAPYIYEHIRFIDDNLFSVPTDRVTDMIAVANNILALDIKFTYEKIDEQSEKGLPFLDTQLFIAEDRRIESRLYTKATDRHAYLLPSSFHPAHITQNIPKAVFGRIRKLCSREEWYREDAGKAEGWLLTRGYKKTEIQKAIKETSQKDRWSMIEQIEQNRDKKEQKKEEEVVDIPLIITYNQHGKKIKKILKDRQPLLDGAFSKTRVKPRLSYRRKRNLNDLVVQKGLRGPIEHRRKELNIFSRCEERPGYRSRCPCKGRHSQDKCRCCMHSRGEIERVENRIYKPVNCNSKNIIYVIGCKVCEKKYVGETQQRVKDRLAQHMYNVDKLNQPLYLHFRQVHKLENLYIVIVETVRGEEPFMRKVREAWWINHLRTLEPSGFNVKLECNQAYEEVGE